MPRTNPGHQYSDKQKQTALKVIDTFLGKYIPEEYSNNIKAMISDQIASKKDPLFIAQTTTDFINYDLKNFYQEVEIPKDTIITLKQNLIGALEGLNP